MSTKSGNAREELSKIFSKIKTIVCSKPITRKLIKALKMIPNVPLV